MLNTQTGMIQLKAQAPTQVSSKSMSLRTGVRAADGQRQQCYNGYLTTAVTGADAACGNDPGCWRGTLGHAIDSANSTCINE